MEERQEARLLVYLAYFHSQLCIRVQDAVFSWPRAEIGSFSICFAPILHPFLLRVRHFCELTKAALIPVKMWVEPRSLLSLITL